MNFRRCTWPIQPLIHLRHIDSVHVFHSGIVSIAHDVLTYKHIINTMYVLCAGMDFTDVVVTVSGTRVRLRVW